MPAARAWLIAADHTAAERSFSGGFILAALSLVVVVCRRFGETCRWSSQAD